MSTDIKQYCVCIRTRPALGEATGTKYFYEYLGKLSSNPNDVRYIYRPLDHKSSDDLLAVQTPVHIYMNDSAWRTIQFDDMDEFIKENLVELI